MVYVDCDWLIAEARIICMGVNISFRVYFLFANAKEDLMSFSFICKLSKTIVIMVHLCPFRSINRLTLISVYLAFYLFSIR